jgi:PleD family two-component response regulator
MLTGRDEAIDQVVGLELGADGYLVKPVTPRLLLAHLRAHLRKTRNQNEPTQTHQLTFGGLTIDASARSAHKIGIKIAIIKIKTNFRKVKSKICCKFPSSKKRTHGLKNQADAFSFLEKASEQTAS